MLEVEESTTPAAGGGVNAYGVCRCAQSARWVGQFALALWGRLSPLVWLSRVRDGQVMTQGEAIGTGSGRDWRQPAGVVS
jgi:hypothetical protein